MTKTVTDFQKMKDQGEKIVMITAYDYAMGKAVAQSAVDLILVGDSVGMTVLGYETTLDVDVDQMIHHTIATRRGAPETFIVVDMPFMSYHNPEEAKLNAADLMVQGKANAVKLEGGSPSRIAAIEAIVDCEIPVCGHIGLTPQSVHRFGGYKVQGKSSEAHTELIRQALAIQEAGAFMLVLEGVPELLGKEITEQLRIPTIGIGAGRYTDGQVLVWHDIMGFTAKPAKFVKVYAELEKLSIQALDAYASEVKGGSFPGEENTYYPVK
jgi:3-methyl-2-oxobutanoate hydroxymethyltransferase